MRLLAARESTRLAVPRNAELVQAGFGVDLIELPVQVAGQMQHVARPQVLVHRRVLRDVRDAVERATRPGLTAAENSEPAFGRR